MRPLSRFINFEMFNSYILKSNKIGTYYSGSCQDVAARLIRHNSGLVRSTKNGVPWEIIFVEYFTTRAKAIKREREIKSWKSRAAIDNLIETFQNLK